MTKSKEELQRELALLLAEKDRRETYDKFHNFFFQDHKIDINGLDISRDKYPAHVEFMEATEKYRELAFIAPNRAGKSETGAFIIACHATKDYPEWWTGKKFPKHKQLEILVLGKTNLAVRDVAQKKLIGNLYDMGTGMLPKESITDTRKKMGTPDALQDLYITDKYGCVNHIQFMSYEIEPGVVMGRELDVAWFDEECMNQDLYNEILMRTMTTNGFVFTTFTPLDGFTEGIMRYMPNMQFPEDGIVRDADGKDTGRYVVHCGWDSAPHLTEAQKEDMKRRFTGAELLARTQGIPTIGSGQVYTIQEDDFKVEPFEIPVWWPRCYALDFGWNRCAAVWGAIDPADHCVYIYSEHYLGRESPPVHASAIKSRGNWIPGVCDPAGKGVGNLQDGKTIVQMFLDEGLDLDFADNAREAGIAKTQLMLQSGRLKVFSTLRHWFDEYRLYRRDEHGQINKKKCPNDHLMDATRYLIMSGLGRAITPPDPDATDDHFFSYSQTRDDITGY